MLTFKNWFVQGEIWCLGAEVKVRYSDILSCQKIEYKNKTTNKKILEVIF